MGLFLRKKQWLMAVFVLWAVCAVPFHFHDRSVSSHRAHPECGICQLTASWRSSHLGADIDFNFDFSLVFALPVPDVDLCTDPVFFSHYSRAPPSA
ncbi:MAG: hypothetical protein HY541_02750 [Deltaproteobacteria bacterium]|nr:hypothetical protein [Deltaproteobacteria bacterium]